MATSPFHQRREELSADDANGAVSDAIVAVKAEGSLTDAQVGRRVSRSGDRVQSWRKGETKMSAETLLRCIAEWQATFADVVLAPTGGRWVPLDASCDSDSGAVPKLARLTARLSDTLDAGAMNQATAKAMLPDLEAAQGVIDRIRRLAVMA